MRLDIIIRLLSVGIIVMVSVGWRVFSIFPLSVSPKSQVEQWTGLSRWPALWAVLMLPGFRRTPLIKVCSI